MSMEDYAQKKATFDKTNAERQNLISRLDTIVRSLQNNPDGFSFANAQGGFPAEVVFGRNNPSVDARQWPSAQDIQNVLMRWHDDKQIMNGAWDALTPEQKGAMQPPPGRSLRR